MNKLTIIIFYSNEYFYKNIEYLEDIFETYDTELVIVSDENLTLSIPYKFEYKFFNNIAKDFKENLITSSTSEKILIIDSGLILRADFITFLTQTLNTNTCFNITTTVKSFISKDKTIFFNHNEVILYNKGIKGFNLDYNDDILLDYSYVECTSNNISFYINNFLEDSNLKDLYTWFSNYAEAKNNNEKALVYTALEKIKEENKAIDFKAFEEEFINKTTDLKYKGYLKCRQSFHKCCKNNDFISKTLKEATTLDCYFSWLLKDIIIYDKDSISLIASLKEDCIKQYVTYLLEKDSLSWDYFNTFIENNSKKLLTLHIKYSIFDSSSRLLKAQLSAFINLCAITIEYMNNNISNPSKKETLLNIFSNYTKVSNHLIKLKLFPTKSKVINCKAHKNLVLGVSNALALDIKDCILALSNLCNKNKNIINTLRYLIQKLRYENNYYSNKLSLSLIVKDEEKNITRCLNSIKPLLDSNLAELVVVDTGSTDNTKKIAEKFTKKVYFHKWENNFSTARNQSLMYCDGEYTFILDADEEISKKDIDLIIEEFNKDDYKNFNTLTLNIVSYTDLLLKYYAVMPQPRIFKNDCVFYYSSAVHNQPVCTPAVKNLEIDILHYGYIMTADVKEKKYNRTVTLLKKELLKNPRHIYYIYQLSSSYAMYGDMKSALKEVDLYMQLISEEVSLYDSVLMYYNNAAAIYINCYIYDKAESVCDKALKISPDFIDFNYYKAFLLFEKRDYKNALIYIEKYLELISNYNEIEVANDGRFAFYTLCSHEEIKKLNLQTHYALDMYLNCIEDIYNIEDNNMVINSLYQFISSCIKTNNLQELDKFYNYFIEKDEKEKETFINIFNYFKESLTNNLYKKDFYLLKGFTFDSLDFDSLYLYIEDILPEIIDLDAESIDDKEELINTKKLLQLIIHRTDDLRYYYLSDEELVDIFNKYMFICSKITSKFSVDYLEPREVMFINKMLKAYKSLNSIKAIDLFHDAIIEYTLMSGIVNLTVEVLYESDESERENIAPKDITTTKDLLNNDINIKDLQTCNLEDLSSSNDTIKVLHGTMDNTEATSIIVNSLKDKGIFARSINYVPKKCSYSSDYEMDVNSFENGKVILERTIEASNYLIPKYNIFHFYHGSSLNFNHEDIELIQKLNKKIVIQLSTEEVRTSSKASELGPYLKLSPDKDKVILEKLTNYSKYASACIVEDFEAYHYVKNIFNKVYVIEPYVKIESNIKANIKSKANNKFTIVHCPINRKVASTDTIIKAIDELKELYDFDFYILDNEPIEKVKEAFTSADLVIDGLLSGSYSKYALYAMALSKAVVSYISDYMKYNYPPDLPIIETNINTFKEDIEKILKDNSTLKAIGEKSLNYVNKYHNEDTQISKLIDLYNNL